MKEQRRATDTKTTFKEILITTILVLALVYAVSGGG